MGHKKVKGNIESKDVNQANTIVVSESTVCLIIEILFIYFVIVNFNSIVPLLYNIIGLFYGQNSCLLSISSTWSHVFDPKIADCSQCEHIDQIVQVTNITRQQFEERFAYSMEPLVVRGIISDWKSLHDFSVDFFAQLYSSANPFYRCQFFPYKTPFKSLREALDSVSGHVDADSLVKNWYIGWSNCDPSITRKLRQYYKRPSFLPRDSEDSRLDWIFMGTPGYGAPMHIDNVGYPSWQAQIKGSKKWILEPPIECYFTCKRFEITVKSGDIIVLDTNKWFHETKIIGNDLSITIGSEYD